jgi:YesN/AraC family two-component response regulator
MLCDLLNRAGFDVIEAKDGEEGIKTYKQESPDLVITDIVMPNQDGIGAIMSLSKEFPEIKIIAVSGGGIGQPHDYLQLAKGLGANQVFTKPIDNQEFLKVVSNLLEE